MENPTAGQLMKRINDAIEKRANNMLRSDGLTMSQVWVLMNLMSAEHGVMPLKAVERSLAVSQPTAAGIVSRLEEKGLVCSWMDDGDRRVKLVSLTESGLQAVQKAEKDVEDLQKDLLSGFTEEEQAQYESFLSRIYQNIK